jgi:hypothetical protein
MLQTGCHRLQGCWLLATSVVQHISLPSIHVIVRTHNHSAASSKLTHAYHAHPAHNPATCPQSISIRESPDGQILVQGAGEEVAAGAEDLARLLALAACTRATGATMINDCSSRSHAIFTIMLEQHILHLGGTRASTPDPSNPSSGAGG